MKKPIKINFFGTSEFAVPALEALSKEGYEIAAVVTTPDQPAGRKQVLTPPPVKTAAEKLGLKVLQPPSLKIEELKNYLEIRNSKLEIDADLGVVASYGKIIPQAILDLFPKGLLNIHPSLLPKYRGPSPIQTALLNGESETGVVIMKVDEKMDHGPVIAYNLEPIAYNDKYQELRNRLATKGAKLLIKVLPDYLSDKLEPREQDHSQATFTKIITKEDGKIDWRKEAQQIYNQYRAFHIWPGIWTSWNPSASSEQHKVLKITDCRLSSTQPNHEHEEIYIGVVYQENNLIYIPCQKGHLEILRLQLAGGKEMSIKEFLAGHRDFVGSKLGE